jgi:hypothetical protein
MFILFHNMVNCSIHLHNYDITHFDRVLSSVKTKNILSSQQHDVYGATYMTLLTFYEALFLT